MKKHFGLDNEHHLCLFSELVRYDEAFYCMKCESYVVVEPFDDFLDAMYATKGSFVNIPVTHKHTEVFENHGSICVSSTMQGWRSANEDSHCIYLSTPKYEGYDFLGVFDGHGGPLVSRYVGTKLLTILEAILAKTPDVGQALSQAFIACDAALLSDGTLNQTETGGCGTTASVVVVDNVTGQYVCANAGDARSILCRGGKAVPLSSDHRPGIPSERDRIRAAGSKISEDERVEGLLAVSRAIGDFDFKQAGGLPPERQAVTCVPDISKTPKHKDDEFIVVACDGIWDCLQSQQVAEFIGQQLRAHNSPIKAAEALLDRCVAKDITDDGIGTDNMSVIILMLK
jgi:protein phosphatase 2C family protein 2/3